MLRSNVHYNNNGEFLTDQGSDGTKKYERNFMKRVNHTIILTIRTLPH
jgi:hypothetical protein